MTKLPNYDRPLEFELTEILRPRYGYIRSGSTEPERPGSVDALKRVASGIANSKTHTVHPMPTPDEMRAALGLADEAMSSAVRGVEHGELILIDGARDAGLSWREIGIALGHTEDTAERSAKDRRARLQKRFPGYTGPYYEPPETQS